MKNIHGLGAFGMLPYLNEDLLKQIKLADIKNRAGKIAYLMSAGHKTKKPEINDGIHEARGALKLIEKTIERARNNEEEENEK